MASSTTSSLSASSKLCTIHWCGEEILFWFTVGCWRIEPLRTWFGLKTVSSQKAMKLKSQVSKEFRSSKAKIRFPNIELPCFVCRRLILRWMLIRYKSPAIVQVEGMARLLTSAETVRCRSSPKPGLVQPIHPHRYCSGCHEENSGTARHNGSCESLPGSFEGHDCHY